MQSKRRHRQDDRQKHRRVANLDKARRTSPPAKVERQLCFFWYERLDRVTDEGGAK